MSLVLWLLACKAPPTETPPPTTPIGETGETGDTAVPFTGHTGPDIPVFDCTNLTTDPAVSTVQGARGYHGLAFDTLGNLVGSDGSSLVRVDETGTPSLWVPNISSGQQMEFMPDGDLAFSASNGAIRRISQAGNNTVIASNVSAYGLIIGPDGFIYTANQSQVHRINPTNGNRVVYVSGVPSPKVINWSPELDKFYIGTNGQGGAIYVVDVDPATNMPMGTPTLFANTSNTWHDALAVDVCGNLYVAEFWDRRLWRFTPDGQGTVLVQYPSNLYGHGFVFGSGIGVWDAMSGYVPQPYNGNTVGKIEIGLPDRRFNGGVYEVIR
ncbi:MAG: SMP-30/gluconolactonase/LRE family protein [Alphaproteobacteria bacterium]|nr:SMP-30/gluconolactonase/LRE family protein [Alphaproteobacteria bacterium]